LLTQTKSYHSGSNFDKESNPFYHLYNDCSDDHYYQHELSKSSTSLTNPNHLQKYGSNFPTIVETDKKISVKPTFIKKILLVDDDPDVTLTFKAGLDGRFYGDSKKFDVYTYNNPILAVKEFKPQFYDLLLTDIYMPHMNGYQLCDKILELDANIRVCFMSAVEVNIRALREVYPNLSFGCFIEKPVSIKYLVNRLSAELD
jgi:CheY-like chemotaxis protein